MSSDPAPLRVAYMDLENIAYGMRGGRLDLDGLTAKLRETGHTGLVAVGTSTAELQAGAEAFRALGWTIYLVPEKRKGNADAAISFLAGAFTQARPPASVTLISSDTGLIIDFAWCMHVIAPATQVGVWFLSRNIANRWLPTDYEHIASAEPIDAFVG
jgi:hypothetical protein